MSLLTKVMGQYNAVLGQRNAYNNFSTNCQNATNKLNNNNFLNFGGQYDNFELNQSSNKFNAKAYDLLAESCKPKDKDFESFAYFA